MKWQVKDRMANKIQCLARGRLGRRRAKILIHINSFNKKLKNGWVEVRDQERGEVWYYNTISAESVWERPEEMGGMTEEEKVKTLPPITEVQKVDPASVVKGFDEEVRNDLITLTH